MSSLNYREIASGADSSQSQGPDTTAHADSTATGGLQQVVDFPEVEATPLRVAIVVGPHVREDDAEVGRIRLRVLKPFALARLGRPFEVWDSTKKCLVSANRSLPLKPYAKELATRLGCGVDLIFEWIKLMCEKGPENVVAEDFLKIASSGGKGGSRLSPALEDALQKAVYKVCVSQGVRPASKKANQAIRDQLVALGHSSKSISKATIRHRSMSPKITFARSEAYQRDHMMRVAGQPDETPGLNSVVVIDTTTFSDEDAELRVVDSQGRDLGPANVIFALLKANKGIWSFRAFAGPPNSFLAGLTIKRGLVAKEPLLKRYSIEGIWPFCGRVGAVNHDGGPEFIGSQIKGAIKRRDIGIDDRSPPSTPHYRAGLERFNRTAHLLFADFLGSDCGKRYLRPVNGRPTAKGILLNDLDKALTEWIVCHYHTRPHAGLGGDTPLSRMDKYVLGQNGLPASGLIAPLDDTDELMWDFLWEEMRTVNHLGIQFMNRRYVSTELTKLFKLTRRSSERKIAFRFNPYAMRWVFVKIPDETGREIITRIEWLPENEKYRPTVENQEASINPSMWEWDVLFADIRRGNTAKATSSLAEDLHAKRESEAAAGETMAGAPGKKERVRDARHRGMRESYGSENLPVGGSGTPPQGKAPSQAKQGAKAPRLLETAGGAEAY